MDLKPFKIVVVGDGMVGKTCLCKSFANKEPYRRPYQPTFETHEISVLIGRKDYPIILWDTAGVEEWEQLRSKDYLGADCFLCCYSVDNRTSFTNVESKWVPELRRYCPLVPIVIVGLKKDLRTPSNFHLREEEGRHLHHVVKAHGFIECSSRSMTSLEAVFVLAVSQILHKICPTSKSIVIDPQISTHHETQDPTVS